MEPRDRHGRGARDSRSGPNEPRRGQRRPPRRWWTRRWLQSMEELGLAERLPRGRGLARQGAVLRLEIMDGWVEAEVRAGRGVIHPVRLLLEPASADAWARLEGILASRAVFVARLLSGELPEEMEAACTEAGMILFPPASGAVALSCPCGDGTGVCAHGAAVVHLLTERIDEDPFVLLELRGRRRADLLEALRPRSSQDSPAETPPTSEQTAREWSRENAASYTALRADLDLLHPRIERPPIPEAVLLRLGPPPGTVADSAAHRALREAYRLVADWALRLAIHGDHRRNQDGRG